MKRRQKVKRRKDKRVFAHTSGKTKLINVRPGEWRGGIRL